MRRVMRRRSWLAFGVIGAALVALAFAALRGGARRADEPAIAATAPLAAGETAGFARALAPRPFVFPEDHGPHPEFRSEWWYFTGNLVDAKGRRFGYQLTIFRQALAASAPAREAATAAREAFMGHLAVTDVASGRLVAGERLARGALGLAGAERRPFRVWVEDWTIEGGDGFFPLRLAARDLGAEKGDAPEEIAIALDVGSGRGPVLQGDRGLSQKGPEPGNASYYYSYTRLPTKGRITIGGATHEVSGESWLDREWSTSALGPDLAGWDWISLHLADGRDVMVYRLRRKDGSPAPESRATIVAPDARTTSVGPDAFSLAELGVWTSPHGGARYPAGFVLRVPGARIDLEVRPFVADQELRLGVRYWEGAVRATSAGDGAQLGTGYLEMTGYGEGPAGR